MSANITLHHVCQVSGKVCAESEALRKRPYAYVTIRDGCGNEVAVYFDDIRMLADLVTECQRLLDEWRHILVPEEVFT